MRRLTLTPSPEQRAYILSLTTVRAKAISRKFGMTPYQASQILRQMVEKGELVADHRARKVLYRRVTHVR